MLQSKLNTEEILKRSFINTETSMASWRDATYKWDSCSVKFVKERLDSLNSIFNNDIQCFAQLDPNDDVIARKLAFKKTESLLNSWKMRLGKSDWWCSTIRNRLNELQRSLNEEREAFIKLFQQATTTA